MKLINQVFAAEPAAVDIGSNFGFGDIQTLGAGYTRLIMPGFELAGIAVGIYLTIGAVKFITSGGDKEAISSARAMITHAIIAYVLLILLFILMKFIPEFLLGAGTPLQIIK